MSVEDFPKTAPKRPSGRIMFTVFVVLMAMATVSFMAIYQVIKAEAHARYMGIRNVSSEKVARIVRGTEMNANNIFDDVGRSLQDPEAVIAALKNKANLNYDVRGYFAAFVPNYFPEKGTWFEPYIYQPEYGGFEYRQVGSARHNYTKSGWYVQAKDKGHSFWSEPYYYYDGTSVSGHYCTFVKPVYDSKGDLACVCGADMKFEWLAKELEWVDESSRSNKIINKYQFLTDFGFYTVILSNDGTCIASPHETTLAITDKDVLKKLQTRKSGSTSMEVDGEQCTLFFGPIEYIDWAVAVVVPKHDILKPLLPVAVLLLSMVVVGMLIVWFICRRK